MAKTLGTLFVEYRATADKFTADLKNMAKEAKEFDKTIKPIRDTALSIGTGMSVVGGLVTGAFVGMARQAANYADAIRDASIRTGISTQSLSGLKFAAEQTGTSFEGISSALVRMSRSALTATQGTNAQSRAFASMGVSVKETTGNLRPMDAILGDVADRFAKMKDGTEKAALAQQLFGRSGATMIEFLNQGKAGISAFTLEAERMGLVVGPEFAKAGDDFNDSMKKMQAAQLGLSVTIGSVILPALIKMAEVVINTIIAFRTFTAAHPELTRAIFLLAGALTGAGGLLVGLAGVLAILPALTTAFTLLTGPIGLTVAAFVALGAAMVAFPKFGAFVSGALKNVIGLFALLGSQLGSIGRALMQLATGQFKSAWETISTSGTRSMDAMVSALDGYDAAVKSASSITNIFAQSSATTGKALQDMGVDLDTVSGKADKSRDKLFELANFLRGAENNLTRPIAELNAQFVILDNKVSVITPKLKAISLGPLLSDMEMLDVALKSNADFTKEAIVDQVELGNAQARTAQEYARALEKATDDIKRSAGKVFDDMFIKGQNVFKSLGNLLKGGVLSLGRAIFEDVAGMLLGPIKLAFDNFFKGLLEKTIGNFAKQLGSQLGGALSKIPGIGGGAVSVAGAATGGAGSVAGSVGGAVSGGIGLAGSLISGGLAAVGGIVGGLMTKGNAKRTEENTREARDWLELMAKAWNPLFHEIRWFQEHIEMNTRALVPTIASDTRPAIGPQLNIEINVGAGATMTEVELRTKLIPALKDWYTNNTQGLTEVTGVAIRNAEPGFVTA